jgi:hypothetical protein
MTRAAQTTILLEKSIEFENLKVELQALKAEYAELAKHHLLMMHQLDVFMSNPESTSIEFTEEYLEACKHAEGLGVKFPQQHLIEFINKFYGIA